MDAEDYFGEVEEMDIENTVEMEEANDGDAVEKFDEAGV